VTDARTTCPVCGAVIKSACIPADRYTPFPCLHCRTQLEVMAFNPVPILAASVLLSLGLCVVLGIRGFAIILVAVIVTAIFYCVGQILRRFLAAPKLEKSRSAGNLLHLGKRIHSSR